MAKLVAIDTETCLRMQPRKPGSMKGRIWMADDFDETMSEEELALWYDAPIFPNGR